ncbi:hypothetical protein AX16_000604 [Volvariella volvacea WC 439]|nr:hypothetical protein AX16_000604 [Volvariella volvacea WC 439]
MARATRSSTQHEKQKSAPQSDPSSTKKRKRLAHHDPNDALPPPKLPRTDIDSKPTDDQQLPSPNSPPLPSHLAGDAPILPEHAQKVLDILEVSVLSPLLLSTELTLQPNCSSSDSQGLLDREFPLPAEAPNSAPQSQSLRGLLKESSQHPLWVLRAAVKQLLPISSHPRFRPSTPAAQQRRFCESALSLLDQASFHTVPVPLDLQTILPEQELPPEDSTTATTTTTTKPTSATKDNSTSTTSTLTSPPSPILAKRKYALVQHLPNGDYWTSLNSDIATPTPPSSNGLDLKDLPTGHAELVAILPAAASTLVPPESVPTLGSYNSTKVLAKKSLPAQRRLTTGWFLDYGVWASFAPTFDQEAELVGRREMGEIIWGWEERKRRWEDRKRELVQGRGRVEEIADDAGAEVQRDTPTQSSTAEQGEKQVEAREPGETNAAQEEQEVVEVEKPSADRADGTKADDDFNLDSALKELFAPEQAEAVKSSLATFELEKAVQELVERNARALARLEELQYARLNNEGGGTGKVDEASEEWETAQGILETLTVLTSLRPRSSMDDSSLIPSPSVLHKLHRTLALEPKPGWYGSLPPNQTAALRDDSTIKLRPGVLNSAGTNAAAGAAGAATGTGGVSGTAGMPGIPASSTPTPLSNAQTATTVHQTTATTTAATPYAGYAYAYNQQATAGTGAAAGQAYRATATPYTPYKPGQTPYYNPYMTAGQGGVQQSYYGQQAYMGAGTAAGGAATGQQPYAAYSSWYANYVPMAASAGTTPNVGGTAASTPAGAAAAGSNSGRGTPQPGVNTANSMAIPTSYATFFGGAGAGSGAGTGAATGSATTPTTPGGASAGGGSATQRTPVVANTVMAGKTPYTAAAASGHSGYGQSTMGQWTAGMYGQGHYQYHQQGVGAAGGAGAAGVPTLPVHLRPAGQMQGQGGAYYGAYQQQQQYQQVSSTPAPASAAPR